MQQKSTLMYKARAAFLGAYEVATGTRDVSDEHRVELISSVRDTSDYAGDFASATTVLFGLAALGVDIEALLSDVFFMVEMNPEGNPEIAVSRIIHNHLDDALAAS